MKKKCSFNQICSVEPKRIFLRFLTAVFIVKNDVKNDPQQHPHFVFLLRSKRGGE